jgi:peptidoglycan/xylan/chitin deacetylase (PgdA/CDA1 family)
VTFLRTTGTISEPRHGTIKLPWTDRIRSRLFALNARASDPADVQRRSGEHEIAGSKAEVEELTGQPCRHISFPNGDYGPRELDLIRRAGYLSARTIEPGWVEPATDPYRLKIVPMPDVRIGVARRVAGRRGHVRAAGARS